jgi:hypothetical protein
MTLSQDPPQRLDRHLVSAQMEKAGITLQLAIGKDRAIGIRGSDDEFCISQKAVVFHRYQVEGKRGRQGGLKRLGPFQPARPDMDTGDARPGTMGERGKDCVGDRPGSEQKHLDPVALNRTETKNL